MRRDSTSWRGPSCSQRGETHRQLLRRRRGREVPCWPGDRRSISGDRDGISHRDRPSPPRSVLGGVPGAGDVLPASWRPSALLVHLGTNDFTPGTRDASPPPHTLWLAAVTGWQADVHRPRDERRQLCGRLRRAASQPHGGGTLAGCSGEVWGGAAAHATRLRRPRRHVPDTSTTCPRQADSRRPASKDRPHRSPLRTGPLNSVVLRAVPSPVTLRSPRPP